MVDAPTVVSVDLDDIACYYAIHGLAGPPPRLRGMVLERCLPRFLELFDELGAKATFFVIGRDLDRDLREGGAGARWLKEALSSGHELANHSYAHAYDLVKWSPEAIRADLLACDRLLRSLGADVRGFRAPGYTHDEAMIDQVRAIGYAYDSSALPSLPYYAAKLGAIGWNWVRGRRSSSMIRGARTFMGGRHPHRWEPGGPWELPIGVTRGLALPFVGTFVLCGPQWSATWMRRAATKTDSLHLELHGLDLADAGSDGVPDDLRRLQPELRTPLVVKRGRLASLLRARAPSVRCIDAVERRIGTSD